MMETRSCRTLLFTLVGVLAVGALFHGPQAAYAVDNCIQDVWQAHGNNQGLTCSAQDVTLSSAKNIKIPPGGGGTCDPVTGKCKCFATQPVTFTADFEMDLTADTRYDVGFYIGTGHGLTQNGALTGQCSATASLQANTTKGFINLDAPPNCGSGKGQVPCQTGDVCGDITGPLNGDHNPLLVTSNSITVTCPASGQVVVPWCTTWRQPGSNAACLGVNAIPANNDVYPGSPSKCNCGTLALDIFSETPSITVTKTTGTTGVLETGGSATYTVTMQNNGSIPVTVTSLTDDKYGDITTTHAAGGGFQAVTATGCVPDNVASTCEVGGSIAAGGSCSCTFTGTVPAGDFPGGFTDIVTGCANNQTTPTPDCKTGTATVPYTDVPQPPTITKTAANPQCRIDVSYSVVVTNGSSTDTLTLKTLNDDKYGDITVAAAAGANCTGTCIVSTTCGQAAPNGPGALPNFVIAKGGNYSCSFVGRISTCNSLTDTVTGTATDDDGRDYGPLTTPPFSGDSATVSVSVTTP